MRAVLIFIVVAFAIGGVAFRVSMRDKPAADRRAGWIKFATYVLIVATAMVAWALGTWALTALVAAIAVRGAFEIGDLRRRAGETGVPRWAGLAYLPVAAFAVLGAALAGRDIVIFVFVVVATFDGCAQVIGQLVGRTALAPRISPNKTVEGFLGGMLMAGVAAFVARDLSPVAGFSAFLLAFPIGLIGLAGDLSASWVKRRAGVKDFRQILPGHGGVLDRFDGLIPNLAVLGVIAMLRGAAL